MRVVVLSTGMRTADGQHREFRVEPPDENLVHQHALLGDDLQEANRIPVATSVHFPDNGEQVPHSLGFTTAQRPEKGRPFSCGWWGTVGQVIDIAGREETRRVNKRWGRGNCYFIMANVQFTCTPLALAGRT